MTAVPTLAPEEYAARVLAPSTLADRQALLDAASAAHREAAYALHAADDALDADWNPETLAAYATARRRHTATGDALIRAHREWDRGALLDRLAARTGE